MAFVSTFHGFCTRLLREHSLLAGLDPDFAILDEGIAARLRERAFRTALGDFQDAGGDGAVELVAAYGGDQLGAMISAVHAELRSRGERVPRLPAARVREDRAGDRDERDAAAACVLLDELLAAFALRYEELKRRPCGGRLRRPRARGGCAARRAAARPGGVLGALRAA